MGDVFFSAAQLARHLGLDSETCLRKANLRFEQRFLKMLSYCGDNLQKFIALTLAEKEALWLRAKKDVG